MDLLFGRERRENAPRDARPGARDAMRSEKIEIDVTLVLCALLAVVVARLCLLPGVFSRRSKFVQLPNPSLKFVDDGAKVRRGPTLDEIPIVCEDMRACFAAGTSLPMKKRKEQLRALLRALREREGDVLRALREDLSREGIEALYYDLALPRGEIQAMLRNLNAWTGRKRVWSQRLITWPSSQWTEKQPFGCALVCSSWNFPFMLSLVPLAGAIAAGNTVVLKPSNESRASAVLLTELVREYCDPRIVQVVGAEVPGNGVDVMQTVLAETFDVIFFTGSSKVGKIVARAAAENLTPTVLELGGQNPVVVTDCADCSLAAKQCVWGRVINCGQQCIAPEYVLCHASRVDAFAKLCAKWIESFVPDASKDGSMSRMGGPNPEARMENIAKLLENAKKGANGDEVVCGGEYDIKTRMVEPTIIKCANNRSPFLRGELFAPILCILPYHTIGEAVDICRSRPKPLSMYVFSRTPAKTRFIIDNTYSGGVTVNGTMWHCAHDGLPFGGVGNSGIGSYHGRYSVECFQRTKPVLQKTRGLDFLGFGTVTDPPVFYLPHASWKTRLMRMVM